jgi:V8-like Glu-specific endopeptidase
MKMFRSSWKLLVVILAFIALGAVCMAQNRAVSFTVPPQQAQAQLDYANAKPMPLPANPFMPQDYGLNYHPFTTERADLSVATNKMYPYRATGKLFFLIGQDTYMCSASLIKKGVVVTAAHCVANYGQQQWYTGWQFIPGYRNGVAPYGIQTAYQAWVMSNYLTGNDNCYVYGVVCPDDVAVIILNYMPGTKAYVGKRTGIYGYAYDDYGFTSDLTHITQLGYPAGLDNALYMERTDSYGYSDVTYSNNTVIGSNMDGGSSGGPWLINFGIDPVLTGETNGSAPVNNTVVGVTGWGYTDKSYKEQGASPFTSGNIVPLVSAACNSAPAACK